MQQKKLVVALATVYGLGWTVLANASPAELVVATAALSSAALATGTKGLRLPQPMARKRRQVPMQRRPSLQPVLLRQRLMRRWM
jgi:hypothetical protein